MSYKSILFQLLFREKDNYKSLLRFLLAIFEDSKEFIFPYRGDKDKEFIANFCINYTENFIKNNELQKELHPLINNMDYIVHPYKELYLLVNGLNNKTDNTQKIASNIVDTIFLRRLNVGGIDRYDLEKYYRRLANAFLSTSNFKIEIENLKDTTDVLMLIDILQDNGVSIIRDIWPYKNLINLPYYYKITAIPEDIEKNIWLKQWFLMMFAK